MKINVGHFYRTRAGDRARIYATDGAGPYPIHGAIEYNSEWMSWRWEKDGRVTSMCIYSPDDLISEWRDEVTFDWSRICPWLNWLAGDSNGSWWLYDNEPQQSTSVWTTMGVQVGIPIAYAPKWTGDWKDSLTKRPEGA